MCAPRVNDKCYTLCRFYAFFVGKKKTFSCIAHPRKCLAARRYLTRAHTDRTSRNRCISDRICINHPNAEKIFFSVRTIVAHRGGFPSIRHNEIRDITADLLSEVCHNVGTEPGLQPITDEQMTYRTANREDGARLDVVAQSFWGRDRQCAYFDIRVFNPFAQSYLNTSLAQCYRRNEQEKKRI